jgi:hypothetical protein
MRRLINRLRRALARRWMLRRLDKIGLARSESEKLVDYVLDSEFPE